MDPNWLLRPVRAVRSSGSAWLIVFVECGLFFPFLPGDTLLFAVGLFIASARRHRARRRHGRSTCRWRCCCSASRRSLGNVVGYEIGRRIGPPLLRARRPDPQAEVLRPDPRLLRQARQQGPGDRPVRAVRAHLHHRGRRRHPDGAAPLLPVERRRRGGLGRSRHPARLLPRRSLPRPAARTSTRRSWRSWPSRSIPIVYEWWKHRRQPAHAARRPRRRPRTPEPATSPAPRPARPWSAPGAPRGRRRRAGSRPRGCGRSRRRPSRRPRPASRSARVASRTAPPVVMTSSTRVTRRPSTSAPSASLQVPYSLACLRTNSAGQPGARR